MTMQRYDIFSYPAILFIVFACFSRNLNIKSAILSFLGRLAYQLPIKRWPLKFQSIYAATAKSSQNCQGTGV